MANWCGNCGTIIKKCYLQRELHKEWISVYRVKMKKLGFLKLQIMLKVIILKYQNVIWEGRFQPIHIGHLSYIKRLLEYGDHLWIFVVENEKSTDVLHFGQKSPAPDFTSIVDTHHVNEKNPLPFWLRYRLVIDTIKFEFGDNVPITVLGGRRLDLAWDIYSKIFPPNRVFITPLRDSFEDCKAKAWRDLGEKVI